MGSPLKALQDQAIAAAQAAGADMFLGIPDAWYEPRPIYGCNNGHVCDIYIKSETRGHLCPECMERVAIIPHGYNDETLRAALAEIAAKQAGK